MEIGEKIKNIAESKNLTAKDLSEKLGRTRQAVYDIYSGKVSVNVDLLKKICTALDIEMYNLFVEGSSYSKPTHEDLRKLVKEVLTLIIEKNYVNKIFIRQLITNIYFQVNQGQGLVKLELLNDKKRDEYPFKEEYREIGDKLTDKEVREIANSILLWFQSDTNQAMNYNDYEQIIENTIDRFIGEDKKMQEYYRLLS